MPTAALPFAIRELLHRARSVASLFEGVAIEGVSASDGTPESVELLLTVPTPRGGIRHRSVIRVRRDHANGFELDLRAHIRAALCLPLDVRAQA